MRIEKTRLDEVKKAYGDIKVLEDISLSLYQGELLCVAGPSGSGKSALVDIISGRMPKDGGRMYVDGRLAASTPIRQAQTVRIFCVWYKILAISGISVEENLRLTQKQGCLSFPTRQGMLHMKETLKPLEAECRLQAPVASLSLVERHTIEICRACCAGMKALILDGIARDCTLKGTEYTKRLVIRLRERGAFILWIDTRPEIMPDAADRLAVLRKGRLAAVLYREEFKRQMIGRIIIGENRKAGREITRSQAEPGGWAMLLSMWEVRARELRDVSFHVYPGEVVGFIHPEDIYCREIVRPLSGEFKVESGSAWLAGRQMELAGGRRNMVRRGFGCIEDYKKSFFPKLDAVENLTIAGSEYFTPGVGVQERLEQAVACDYLILLDIQGEDLKRSIKTLSHRCQLNVALYKWIIVKARLIVIDNLFSGTGMLIRNSVRELLESVKSRGIGVVYYSLNERELVSVCDRLYELAEGRASCR